MMNESLILYVIAAILILSTKFPFNKTLALIVFFVYLLNALPTGADYAYYKAGFENVELINSPPYISTDYLDSEPLYLLHMYLLKKVVWNFNLYLAVSFILWAFLSKMALTKLNVPKKRF